jgi:hypothetical protein
MLTEIKMDKKDRHKVLHTERLKERDRYDKIETKKKRYDRHKEIEMGRKRKNIITKRHRQTKAET